MSYEPRPIDTSGIALSPELDGLTERLAENAHDTWAKLRVAEGWSYGPVRDEQRKRTPDLVPYAELEESRKVYDRALVREVLMVVLALGYRIERYSGQRAE